MASPPDLTVISLGGGVQSSVMALMAGEGALTAHRTAPSSPAPTGSRPASTPTWIGCPGI